MRNIFNFIVCLAIAVLLTIEISGTGGVFIIVLLLCSFFISAALLAVTYKTLQISVELSTRIVNKGESFDAQININKKTFLPTSFIEIEIGSTPNVSCEKTSKFKIISSKKDGDVFTLSMLAELCGNAEVFVKSVTLVDYLGIIRKKITFDESVKNISIIPHIPQTGSQAEVLKSTSENMSFDDSDEESDETALNSTGVPGFEHREYVTGDPLKRINWKLSSKKNVFMVRLDEKVTSSSQIFQLDYPECETPDRLYYENTDKIIESSLAMLAMLLNEGFESEFNFYLGSWQMVKVRDYKDIQYLQEQLAGIKPYPIDKRLPDVNINKKGKAQICFTTCMVNMKKELSVLLDGMNGSLVVSKMSGVGKVTGNIWSVTDDFEFEKM